jgi:hypothetical protein
MISHTPLSQATAQPFTLVRVCAHSYACFNTQVWIPISGTSFTGDVWSNTGKGGYVRGKRIQTAVIAELLDNHGMRSATNIILTGGSSGGLAVYLTCDRVAEQAS